MHHQRRTLTELDHLRVSRLLATRAAATRDLQDMLDSSDLVPSLQVPDTVVTMRSRVLLRDQDGTQSEVTLCYPQDADPSQGHLSVLSPAGAALLGLRAGGEARWRTPGGEERAASIVAILFQPEAAGEYLR
jgi:regulator of nucleoside diphosphate kinase